MISFANPILATILPDGMRVSILPLTECAG